MPTYNINHDRWESFLKDFTRRHQGWLVSVEVLRPDIGAQVQARDVPLREILYETRSRPDTVVVLVGKERGEQLTHAISSPKEIVLLEKETGEHEALDIRDAEGGETIIRFRTSALPDTLDGIVEPEYAGTGLPPRRPD